MKQNTKLVCSAAIQTALAMLMIVSIARAQSDSAAHDRADLFLRNVSIGGFGGADLNESFTNFRYLPGVPACSPAYQRGSGVSGMAGLAALIPLGRDLSLTGRAGYTGLETTLTTDESTMISVASVATPATIRHSVAATLGVVGLDAGLSYRLFGNLYVGASIGAGYLLQKHFIQKETLQQPSTIGTFSENNSRTRNQVEGTLPDAASILTSIAGGIRYVLPLNASGSLHAIPELAWSQGLTPIVRGIAWNVSSLRGGVSIVYTLPDPTPDLKPILTSPPPIVLPHVPALIAQIHASGVESDGTEEPAARLKVEEIYETRTSPLVPYIFFNEGDSVIPDRYARLSALQQSTFSVAKLYALDRISLYHHTLNIVGERLAATPSSTITLTGCNAGGAGETRSLSMARAEAVRDYLTNVWRLSPERIKIVARDLPQNFSPVSDSDGTLENCRVEIASSEPSVIAPVLLADTVRSGTPPRIRFHPTAITEAGITGWRLIASQDGTELKVFSGTNTLPRSIDWDLNADQQHIPRSPGKLDYMLSVQDSRGAKASAEDTLAIEQFTLIKKKLHLVNNAEIERYSLLLFDFKSAELSSAYVEVLHSIKAHLKPGSTVTVEGYCDRIGNPQSNRILSEERAKATAKELGAPNSDVRGSNELLYDNNLPEGRVYSRTVEVTVRTPAEVAQ